MIVIRTRGNYTAAVGTTLAILTVWLGFVGPIRPTNAGTLVGANTVPLYRFDPAKPLLFIQAKIDGAKCIFLLDVGQTMNAISQPLVKKLGLHPVPKKAGSNPATLLGWQGAEAVEASTLQIGAETVPNAQFVIADEDMLTRWASGAKIDGVIGIPYTGQRAVEIDLANQDVTFICPGNLTPDDVVSLGFGASNPIYLWEYDPYHVRMAEFVITCGSRTDVESMYISSGATDTVLPSNAATSLSVTPKQTQTTSVYGAPVTYFSQFADNVSIGEVSLGALQVKIADPRQKNTTFDLLGLDLFSKYKILIDFPSDLMYLSPVS